MEIHVFVCIGCEPLFGGAAGLVIVADPCHLYHADFWTYPFVPVGVSFFMVELGIFHIDAAVFGTCVIAVNIILGFFNSAFILWVIGDDGL